MLQLLIPRTEFFDNNEQKFYVVEEQILNLEHSLSSIYAWESKWKRSFFAKGPNNLEESIDYVRCMTLNEKVDPLVYMTISQEQFNEINRYIDDERTATTFSNMGKPGRKGTVTSEIVYYWMVSLNINPEWEYRHFNQLLTLIRVINIKNSPPKKLSQKDAIKRMQEINEANRKKYNTKG